MVGYAPLQHWSPLKAQFLYHYLASIKEGHTNNQPPWPGAPQVLERLMEDDADMLRMCLSRQKKRHGVSPRNSSTALAQGAMVRFGALVKGRW